jgi:hypothetical protein
MYKYNSVTDVVSYIVREFPETKKYFKGVKEAWQIHVAFAKMVRDGMGVYTSVVYEYEYSAMRFMFNDVPGQNVNHSRDIMWDDNPYEGTFWAEADHGYVVYGPGY